MGAKIELVREKKQRMKWNKSAVGMNKLNVDGLLRQREIFW